MSNRILSLSYTVVAVAVVLMLDQLTKAWVTANLALNETRPVIEGVARLRYVGNTGAAFGFFQGWTGPLSIVGIAITLVVIFSASKMGNDSGNLSMLALGLVIGGAIGNLADRFRLGHVVDFFEVYGLHVNINNTVYTWPVFNVADSAISVGVVLLLFTLLFKRDKVSPEETEEPVHYASPGHSA